MREPPRATKRECEQFHGTLTHADRAAAHRIVAEILETPGYALARQWIGAALLIPTRKWRTCSIARVVEAMRSSTGHQVTIEQMALALADAGFVAREIDGEPSTNVKLRYLPKPGARIGVH